MKILNNSQLKDKSWLLLIAGILSISLTHMTFTVDFVAWFSNVPFLIYLSISKGLKSRLLFVLTLIIAWSVVVLKIISPPLTFGMIFLFSVPISMFHLPAYLIWDRFKNYKYSMLLFPALFTIQEWIQYSFSPFASWGAMAYSQIHNIAIMQFISIFGLAGLSFIIYWVNISITRIVLTKRLTVMSFYLPVSILIIFIIFGSLRFDISKSNGVETMKVACVGTNSTIGGLPLPSEESNMEVINDLLQKSSLASQAGAEIIVWNEASFYALPETEKRIQQKIKSVALTENISIIASYVVPISYSPFKYENKFIFLDKEGNTAYSYLKHQPVPGEPAIKGKEKFKTVNVSNSKVGAAICYDYDFPYIAREYGHLHADIVAVPSSDWRGIDPIHTRMAAFRAIEQGHSIIRSTRFGLSAVISPYGEIVSQSSSFNTNNKILISDVPAKGLTTIYSIIGDVFVYINIAFVTIFFIFQIKNRKFSIH